MSILKSKLILFLLFLSLSLNITHDFFMKNQNITLQQPHMEKGKIHAQEVDLSKLHHFFHFTATIQKNSEFIFPYLSYIQPLFNNPIPPTSSSPNTFRPPIS